MISNSWSFQYRECFMDRIDSPRAIVTFYRFFRWARSKNDSFDLSTITFYIFTALSTLSSFIWLCMFTHKAICFILWKKMIIISSHNAFAISTSYINEVLRKKFPNFSLSSNMPSIGKFICFKMARVLLASDPDCRTPLLVIGSRDEPVRIEKKRNPTFDYKVHFFILNYWPWNGYFRAPPISG